MAKKVTKKKRPQDLTSYSLRKIRRQINQLMGRVALLEDRK